MGTIARIETGSSDVAIHGGAFFENPEAALPQASTLNPIQSAAQFNEILDSIRAHAAAQAAAQAEEARSRPARLAAEAAQRMREESLGTARWAIAKFAATLGNIHPTLPPDTREALMVRTILGCIDAFTDAPGAPGEAAKEPS